MGEPKRSPTATLTVSSSICKPKEEMGRTFSHAPDSLAVEDNEHSLWNPEHSQGVNQTGEMFSWCTKPCACTKLLLQEEHNHGLQTTWL